MHIPREGGSFGGVSSPPVGDWRRLLLSWRWDLSSGAFPRGSWEGTPLSASACSGAEGAGCAAEWGLAMDFPLCLQVLEMCVNNCGESFIREVGKFRFLNSLIKVLSPKVRFRLQGRKREARRQKWEGGIPSRSPQPPWGSWEPGILYKPASPPKYQCLGWAEGGGLWTVWEMGCAQKKPFLKPSWSQGETRGGFLPFGNGS